MILNTWNLCSARSLCYICASFLVYAHLRKNLTDDWDLKRLLKSERYLVPMVNIYNMSV